MSKDTSKYIKVHHTDGSYDLLPYPTIDQYGHVEVAYDTNSPFAHKRYKLAWVENDDYDCWDAEWAWPTFLNYVPRDTCRKRPVWDKNNCNEPDWKYDDFVPDEIDSRYALEKVADIVVDILGERIGVEWQLRVDPTGGALVWDFGYDDVDVLPKERLGDIVDLGSKTKGYRLIAMCDDLVEAFNKRYGNMSDEEFDDWKVRDETARAVLEEVLDAAHDGKGLNWLCEMVNDFKANKPDGPLADLPEWAYRIYDDAVWYYDPDELKNIGGSTMSDDEKAGILEKDVAYAYHLLEDDPMDQICSLEICGHNPDADIEEEAEHERMFYFNSFDERNKAVVKNALTPPYHAKSDEFIPALVPFWNGRGDKPEGMYWVEVSAEDLDETWVRVDVTQDKLQAGDRINNLLHIDYVRTVQADSGEVTVYDTELGHFPEGMLLERFGKNLRVRRCTSPDKWVVNGHVFTKKDLHCELCPEELDDICSANLFDMKYTREECQDIINDFRVILDGEESAAKYLGIPVEDLEDDTDAFVFGSTGRVAVFRWMYSDNPKICKNA